MKYLIIILFSLFSCLHLHAQDDLDKKVLDYIDQYKRLAMEEQVNYGIPASITLAQGIHESASGQSRLALEANNHFGIKCKKDWTGSTILHDDDSRQECFRKYKTAEDSYHDHSFFLKNNPRYQSLFELDKADYLGWSIGLKNAGYATNPKYASRLVDLIEKYNLQRYTYDADKVVKETEPTIAAEIIPQQDANVKVEENFTHKLIDRKNTPYYQLTTLNELPGFYAKKGDYLLAYAIENNIRLAKLHDLNDLIDDSLYADMFIYLKKKAKIGTKKYHIVEEGESMHSISQVEAIQLKYLYIYNNLYDGEEPAVGEKLYLRLKSDQTPRLRGQSSPTPVRQITYREPVETNQEDEIVISKSENVETIVPTIDKKEIESNVTKQEINRPSTVPSAELNTEEVNEKVIKEIVTQEIVDSSRWIKKDNKMQDEIVTSPNKPAGVILDIEKAKKIEKILNDGKNEVDKLAPANTIEVTKPNPVYKEIVTQEEIIISNPTPAEKIIEEKKNAQNKYEEKNVSEDVKDLKKKFDSILYKK